MSEAEVYWRAFLDSLIERGLRGVKFIASDDHAGLKAARKAMFPGVPWQRCQFHLQHNAQGYVSKIDQRTVVARQIRSIFSAPDVHEATRLLNIAIEGWGTAHPKLAAWGAGQYCAGLCGVCITARAPRSYAHDQWLGANQQGAQAQRQAGNPVSQRGQLPAPGERNVGRTRRGVDDCKNLSDHETLNSAESQQSETRFREFTEEKLHGPDASIC